MREIIEDMMAFEKPKKIVGLGTLQEKKSQKLKMNLVYTHFHWDHVAGGGAIQELADSLGQKEPIRVIAHNFFIREYSRQLLLGKSGYPRGMGQGWVTTFLRFLRTNKVSQLKVWSTS